MAKSIIVCLTDCSVSGGLLTAKKNCERMLPATVVGDNSND
jgi:hypothetical protein